MSKSSYVSAGSSTRVKDGPGTLFGAWFVPVAGSTLLLADNPDLGSGGPNFNNRTAITSTIASLGVYPASPVPVYFDAHALRFANALAVAASSSSPVPLFFD